MAPQAGTTDKQPESKAEAEALIPQFALERVLNQDQSGRRITILGKITNLPALLTLERAAFPSDPKVITTFLQNLANTTNLGANDVYRWYMSNHVPASLSSSSPVPDLKVNLIFPCTPQHIKKYTSQPLRYVTESSQTYTEHVKPWVERTQRTPARLDWIYNILDGITEQEDVIYRSPDDFGSFVHSATSPSDNTPIAEQHKSGFILLPDLNWDRKTVKGLHLLALVQRRDLWSLRGLKKDDVPWLKAVRDLAVQETARFGQQLANAQNETNGLDEDMLKCYVHYQPTYYHFHIHVVHVMLEPEGTTQSVGKAFALENLISQLEHLAPPAGGTNRDAGLDQIDLSYFVGEQSDLWSKCFSKIKQGKPVALNN